MHLVLCDKYKENVATVHALRADRRQTHVPQKQGQ